MSERERERTCAPRSIPRYGNDIEMSMYFVFSFSFSWVGSYLFFFFFSQTFVCFYSLIRFAAEEFQTRAQFVGSLRRAAAFGAPLDLLGGGGAGRVGGSSSSRFTPQPAAHN